MKYFAILMTALIFAGCSMHSEPQAELDECSRLAEDVSIPEYHFMGVTFEKLDAKKAVEACTKRLNADPLDPHAQFLLARALTKNKEYIKAFDLLKKSCSEGDQAGCSVMGGYYFYGFPPVKFDRDKALSIHEKACEKGGLAGCFNVSEQYVFDADRIEDKARGEKLMFETCKNGLFPACQRYAEAVFLEKIPLDEKKYIYAASQACEAGVGCFLFWDIFEKRKDEKSLKTQFQVTKTSCENGFLKACNVLGYFYFVGSGTEKNIEQSLKAKEQACTGGILKSCNDTGQILLNLNRDTDRAVGLIDGACRSGYDWACYDLGKIYLMRPDLAKMADASKEIFAFGCKKYNHRMSCNMVEKLNKKQ